MENPKIITTAAAARVLGGGGFPIALAIFIGKCDSFLSVYNPTKKKSGTETHPLRMSSLVRSGHCTTAATVDDDDADLRLVYS